MKRSHQFDAFCCFQVILDLLDVRNSVTIGRMHLADARAYGITHHGLYRLTQFSQLYPIHTYAFVFVLCYFSHNFCLFSSDIFRNLLREL